VVVDLDNTLFDWVDIWYRSFKAMLDVLVRESGVAEEILIRDFKGVHKKHGTSEYAFSIEELPALQEMYPGEDLRTRFAGAVEAYRKARESALRLYPTVLETLETLKDARCLLVGYTESMSFYSRYRMRSLGLDRILDYLYSPPDHEVPPRVQSAYPEERDRLRRTIHLELAAGTTKPNPGVLREIVRGVGATKEETIYVGDSLMKDVLMAQEAGVTGVWAKYGTAHNREEYELLRKVTHWKQSDVEREKRLRQNEIKPTFVLEKEFSEILSLFDFSPFIEKSSESLARVVDIWKKTVEVQQHFNGIELRIRNFAGRCPDFRWRLSDGSPARFG
jgi:phosphoglycolate phosphatase